MSPARRLAVMSRRHWRRPLPSTTQIVHRHDGTGATLCGQAEPVPFLAEKVVTCSKCNDVYNYRQKKG